jgi:ComF family protein
MPGRMHGSVPLRLMRSAGLALPQHCELCAAYSGEQLVCDACSADLPRLRAACPVCALPSAASEVCGGCIAAPPPWSRTRAAFAYAFPVDRLLQQLKYGGRLALADWAGAAMASAVRASLARRPPILWPDRVVALPLSDARQRERGFNQAREIAARAAREVAIPLAAPLKRVGATAPQAALPWKARAKNVRGAFSVSGDVRGARIALVDDVMTTGATLAEATRTLVQAGAADVECWIVARTLRSNDRQD